MDINNKNTQQTLFCRQFSFKFCAKHFLTKILHFIKNDTHYLFKDARYATRIKHNKFKTFSGLNTILNYNRHLIDWKSNTQTLVAI